MEPHKPVHETTMDSRAGETKRGEALSSLHHVIDLEWMQKAYELTRKDGATGIDGVTADEYEANWRPISMDLLERIKSGRYRAPPVRRAYIPKADGSQRPLGIPTFEDKVAQRAIVMVLEAVYEQDFLSLLLWLPAGTLVSRCAAANCAASSRSKDVLGAGCRYTKVLRFDSAPPPAGVSRPASDGWRTFDG